MFGTVVQLVLQEKIGGRGLEWRQIEGQVDNVGGRNGPDGLTPLRLGLPELGDIGKACGGFPPT